MKAKNLTGGACLALLVTISSIYAAPITCPDSVGYTVYLTTVDMAGGCVIGDKLFTNFSYSSTATGGATPVAAAAITITTEGPAGSGSSVVNPEYGFLFNALWFAGTGQSIDSLIGYTVSVVGGAALIDDTSLLMVGGHLLDGASGVNETVCLGASLPPCPGGSVPLSVFSDGGTQPTDDVSFAPQSTVGIMKDIFVRGGTAGNDNANISGVLNTVSQVSPEPATMSLMGVGLLGIGLLGRRLRT